jgi:hypothetical protein
MLVITGNNHLKQGKRWIDESVCNELLNYNFNSLLPNLKTKEKYTA